MFLPISHEDLKKILLEAKLVKEENWESAERNARRRRRGVEEVLIERGFINESYLFELIGNFIKVPYVNLKGIKLEEKHFGLLPQDLAKETRCLIFGERDGKLLLASVNPLDTKAIDKVRRAAGQDLIVHFTSERGYRYASRLYNSDVKDELLAIIQSHIKKIDGQTTVGLDLPIVKIVELVLEYAILEQASDVHIEPLSDAVVVRFRVDGELEDKLELPVAVKDALVARIKIMGNLKIDEHRVPQDGRLGFIIDQEEESARVSIIPTLYGEKVVLRLLSEESQSLSLQNIGLNEKNLKIVLGQIKKPFGMILVVGPTGSGKTTTLYAILNILNTEDVNISTIEDPIEYGIRRVNQTQVNHAAGYTFASGLRSLLRQDPDTIMIGEIRDGETAQIAVRAALTGHLVLSTLHTNNAAGAPPRLLDMGVEPFLVASTLNIVIAQRLVRRICLECIVSYKLSSAEIRALSKSYDLLKILGRMQALGAVEKGVKGFSDLNFYRGHGCVRCHGTGYVGRIGVMEVLVNSHAIQQATIKHMSSDEIETIATREAMINMFDDAMQKALLGVTTIEEVLRITRE